MLFGLAEVRGGFFVMYSIWYVGHERERCRGYHVTLSYSCRFIPTRCMSLLDATCAAFIAGYLFSGKPPVWCLSEMRSRCFRYRSMCSV